MKQINSKTFLNKKSKGTELAIYLNLSYSTINGYSKNKRELMLYGLTRKKENVLILKDPISFYSNMKELANMKRDLLNTLNNSNVRLHKEDYIIKKPKYVDLAAYLNRAAKTVGKYPKMKKELMLLGLWVKYENDWIIKTIDEIKQLRKDVYELKRKNK